MPGSSVRRNTSASATSSRSGGLPWLAVIVVMRVEPRSGQTTPEPTKRKCGATIRRVNCSSVSLVSAKTIQCRLGARLQRARPRCGARCRRRPAPSRPAACRPARRSVRPPRSGRSRRRRRDATDWTANGACAPTKAQAEAHERQRRRKPRAPATRPNAARRDGRPAPRRNVRGRTQIRHAAPRASSRAKRTWSRQAPLILR